MSVSRLWKFFVFSEIAAENSEKRGRFNQFRKIIAMILENDYEDFTELLQWFGATIAMIPWNHCNEIFNTWKFPLKNLFSMPENPPKIGFFHQER